VHTVIIDGRVVVDAYRQTFVDEPRLFAKVQEIGEKLQTRTGTTFPRSRWQIGLMAKGASKGPLRPPRSETPPAQPGRPSNLLRGWGASKGPLSSDEATRTSAAR